MFIDPRNAKVTVWLVKFPNFVSRKLREQPPGTPLGTLTIKPTTPNDTHISYTPSQELLASGIPAEYNVQFSNVTNNMYVLKLDSKLGRVEGFINKECSICPVINKEYIAFKRAHGNKYVKRETQTISILDANKKEKMDGVKELDLFAKKRKKMLQDKKRERLDKNEVMDIIFRAFETNDSWTAKELGDFSGQPLAYISELLPEICYMNKKDQRNTWHLKDEYKCQKR